MKKTKKQKIWITIFTAFVVFWMGIVFLFSSQKSEESLTVSGTVIDWLKNDSTTQEITVQTRKVQQEENGETQEVEEAVDQKHTHTQQKIIRKLAHFTLYVMGGMLIYLFIYILFPKWRCKIGIAFGSGILYAITDEVHQYFVPGRTALVSDVIIDSMGVLCGILLIAGIQFFTHKIKNRKKKLWEE